MSVEAILPVRRRIEREVRRADGNLSPRRERQAILVEPGNAPKPVTQ
jgi:hypothetical protein